MIFSLLTVVYMYMYLSILFVLFVVCVLFLVCFSSYSCRLMTNFLEIASEHGLSLGMEAARDPKALKKGSL